MFEMCHAMTVFFWLNEFLALIANLLWEIGCKLSSVFVLMKAWIQIFLKFYLLNLKLLQQKILNCSKHNNSIYFHSNANLFTFNDWNYLINCFLHCFGERNDEKFPSDLNFRFLAYIFVMFSMQTFA